SCGSWASWEPTDGSRNTNTSNWIIETTSDNEQFCVTYDPATGRVVPNNAPTGYYLRGTLGPCGWNDLSGSCRLTDPDNDNIYELVIDFGGVPQGRQEAKVYHVDSDTWYPLTFSNGWYYHQGGTVTVRFDANTGEVQIIEEGFTPSICAPGEFSGWNNGYSMNDYGNGVFCIPVASAGTYQWKPTVCGSWDSWQPNTGERNTNADNWVTTIEYPGQLLCVTYDAASGKVLPGSLDSAVAVPTMSQWGLILLCLIVLTLGMVTVRQRQLAMAGSESAGFSLRNLPFDRARFTRALRWAGLAIVAVFAVAVLVFGYVMTTADVPGSLLALPLVAYLMTLLSE
ncbi:MAG: IPTL-CTERM sorting domain-containing protein, partial [Lewinella sp.]|nr:IPTL-CTERM sorting domain-containing protein [Lewinella sp.]